ncbi:anthranilate phosphoribosyltransferase [Smaragdicoccus niigatensis]|uniref:anthranilate phosphoribosyltransferase n=1 Tax=Smaragdicoccus niigatensis TaxID=359359 RepID=UPI0003654B70|nr:anthranilate phosphoribosyltransferase [Smaragdicoccus niigatensis]
MSWAEVLDTLTTGGDIGAEGASWAMNEIMSGSATPAQIAAFGVALKMKGPKPDELMGLSDTMLSHAAAVPVDSNSVDIVGTGGDRAGTVNISTMASIVVAGAGIRVVKHGNRAASSKSGGADVLEALGVKIDLGPDGVAQCVNEVGIGFCFAPVFHPAFRFAGPPRKEIGIPTVFNVVGPLSNPARPRAGLVGCAFADLAPIVAGVFAGRGATALVVRGDDGLDEITTTSTTHAYVVSDGQISEVTLSPEDFGLPIVGLDALRGADAVVNAAIARDVLAGKPGAVRDAVVLNAGAAIAAFEGFNGNVIDAIKAGISRAEAAIDSGAAAELLAKWATTSQRIGAKS